MLLLILFLQACAAPSIRTPLVSSQKAAKFNAQLGASYLHRGNLNQAKYKLEKALEQDANNITANSTYALFQARLGKIKEADRYFRKALRLSKNDAEILNNYGTFLCQQKQPREAEKRFLEAAKDLLYQTPEYAYTNAGICALDHRQFLQAAKYLKKALSLNPRFGSALRTMANLYQQKRRYRLALVYLQRYHKYYTESPATLWMSIKIYRGLKNAQQANAFTAKLRRQFPDSAETESIINKRSILR
ncbi:MAG: type IV pilus biogenesis/stability protein PilW [Gammaproteobacteria bacterium]|nr:type IV pilus biogenesis/stability protein PilW [Gammaproteobacteria bacterium]